MERKAVETYAPLVKGSEAHADEEAVNSDGLMITGPSVKYSLYIQYV
jgi:hypothetical protein